MPDIEDVRGFLAEEHGLAVVSTVQRDGRILSSVANCGVIDHPVRGEACPPWSRPAARPAWFTSVAALR